MDEAMEQHWRSLSEEVISGVKEWQLAHPKATFREIEEEVHERMSRLEAQLVQEATITSELIDWYPHTPWWIIPLP
jgi:Zn-dependent oligopeptidase